VDIIKLYETVEPDEIVDSSHGVWYASYVTELAILTNVAGPVRRYVYVDAADLESAMRMVRRYAVEPDFRKHHNTDLIDAFFEAEGGHSS